MDNKSLTASQAIEKLEEMYTNSVAALRDAIKDFIVQGTLPDIAARAAGLFVYPELRVSWDGVTPAKTRPAPMAASLIPDVMPIPSRIRSFSAITCWNNFPCWKRNTTP